jgi:hypothetical protein
LHIDLPIGYLKRAAPILRAAEHHSIVAIMSWARGHGVHGTWILVLSLAGCLGGQTGQDSEAAPDCEEQAQAVELDMSTSLGFSADGVIAAAGSPLRAQARFFGAGVTREVSLRLQSATAARVVRPAPGSVGCVERLEIDASVSFATADGAFDESFATTLRALDVRTWSLQHTLPLAQLHGSYDASEYDLETGSSPRIRIEAHRQGDAFSGRLGLDGDDARPGDGSEPTSAYIAEWPFSP